MFVIVLLFPRLFVLQYRHSHSTEYDRSLRRLFVPLPVLSCVCAPLRSLDSVIVPVAR